MVSKASGTDVSTARRQASSSQVSSSHQQLPLLCQDLCGAGYVAISRGNSCKLQERGCQQPACMQAEASASTHSSNSSDSSSSSSTSTAELPSMLSPAAAVSNFAGTSTSLVTSSSSSSLQASPAVSWPCSRTGGAAAAAPSDAVGPQVCRTPSTDPLTASSAGDGGSYAEEDAEEGWASGSQASSSDTFSEVGDPAATEVVYVREGVAVRPSRTRRILGRLSLVKQHAVLFIAWLPYSAPQAAADTAQQLQHAGAAQAAAAGSSTGAVAGVQQQNQEHGAQLGQQRMQEQGQQGAEQQLPLQFGDALQQQASYEEQADVHGLLPHGCDEPEQPDSTWLEQQQQQQQEDTDMCSLPLPLAAPRQQQQQQQQGPHSPTAPSAAPAAGAAAPGSAAPGGSSGHSSSSTSADAGRGLYAIHPIPLSDVKALVKHTPPLGVQQLTVVLGSGLTLPPLHFLNGGLRELLAVLRQHGSLVKAAGDGSTYLVNDTADPLQRCLLALDGADVSLGAPPPGVSCVQAPSGLDLPLLEGSDAEGASGWQAVCAAAGPAAAGRDEAAAGSSSSLFGPGSSGRVRLSAAAAAAAAAASAAVRGSGSPALPHLPWSGFGAGYAGASSYALSQPALVQPGPTAAAAAAAAAPSAAAACAEDVDAFFGEGGRSSSSSAWPGGLHGSSAWGGLRGKLTSQLNSTLSKVGQLAVEGASSLVAAAMDSWHAETTRQFEQVELYADWEQQQQHQQIGHDQDVPQTAAAAAGSPDGSSSSPGRIRAAGTAAGDGSKNSTGQVGLSAVTAAAAAAAAAGESAAAAGLDAAAVDIIAAAAGAAGSPSLAAVPAADVATSCGADVAHTLGADVASTLGADVATSCGAFELLEDGPAGPADQLAAVRARAAPPPLSCEELVTFLDGAGRLADEAGFRERVFQAGIEPAARREAWKFLLGVYPPGSTSQQRQQQRLRQQQQYALLLGQWAAVGPEQARRWGKWRERRSRIDKDVARTDRLQPFYRGRDASRHLAGLRDVLRAYCLFNWDLGYCQGMSDLASPLLVAMEGDEVDAFWCFVGLMERMAGNFAQDQAGMHTQLAALQQLVRVLDPPLHAFFEARGCLHYFFAFRWLLIHFKREFGFDQVLCLWECCWACPLTPHLHLYLAAAVLIQHRRLLLADEALDCDGLLRFCVELSGRLDLTGCLRTAEALALIAGQAGAELLAGLP